MNKHNSWNYPSHCYQRTQSFECVKYKFVSSEETERPPGPMTVFVKSQSDNPHKTQTKHVCYKIPVRACTF